MTNKTASSDNEFELPDDWRGEVMSQVRKLIKEADPEITEEVKYKTVSNPNGVLVWYKNGMISTGEVYKQHLRLGLVKGNILKDENKDPKGLINSYRAVLIHQGDELDEEAFRDLIQAAVKLNSEKKNKKK